LPLAVFSFICLPTLYVS